VQTRTQLNASKSIGNRGKGQGGNRMGHSANDEKSTNHQQRHGN
jgi:hypothetical protein